MSLSLLISNVRVTGSALLYNANFTGIGGTQVFVSGQQIFISGAAGSGGGGGGTVTQPQLDALSGFTTGVSGYLLGRIIGAAAGVSSLNGASGAITLVGTGGISIGANGQLILISGANWATSGDLLGLSGWVNANFATQTQLALTGQQAWTAANVNGINLSGNLGATGTALYTMLTGESGSLVTQIIATGQAAINQANGIGSVISGNLTNTGTLLSAVKVTGSSIINLVNLTGLGGTLVFQSGNQVFISGAGGGGNTSFANPSALIGLIPVNGIAATAMQSDSAPAIDQGISPVWTGIHIFFKGGLVNSPTGQIMLANPTAATTSVQQFSPSIIWSGNAWKNLGGASSQAALFRAYVQPIRSANTNPISALWTLESLISGGAYSGPLTYSNKGLLTTPNLNATGNVVLGNTSINVNGLNIIDSALGNYLTIVPSETLSLSRRLQIIVNDADRTLALVDNTTLGDWFNQNVKSSGIPTFYSVHLTGLNSGFLMGDGSGNLTGVDLFTQINSLSGFTTGISGYLLARIAGASAGVSAINGASGSITLLGTGGLTVGGAGQIIYISGDQSISGALTQTGTTLYSLITGGSGLYVQTGTMLSYLTGIATGWDTGWYGFNYTFPTIPRVVATMESNGSPNMYGFVISGRSTSGFYCVFSDLVTDTGLYLDVIAKS